MTIFVIILSGILGSFLLRTPGGFILGGLIGYLLVRLNSLEKKIAQLETNGRYFRPEKSAHRVRPSVVDSPPPVKTATAADNHSVPETPLSQTPPSFATVDDISFDKTTDRLQSPKARPPLQASREEELDHNTLANLLKSYFTGGNTVVRVGVVVLFFGVSFLIKYTVEQNLVPIELRLTAIGIGGIAMLVFGWRLRTARFNYALILQGGGVGILYMDIFGAMRLYHLIPFGLALLLLVCLSFFSALLAIAQNGRALAVIGIIGGFLAPILTSTGSGNHVMLFGYYVLLNCGILFTAKYKAWRELNLLGFFFTFVIATTWGVLDYKPDKYISTQPFLAIFFVFYVLIGLLFTRNQPLRNKGYVDCTLIFGTPLVCFGLQAALVKDYEYGLAFSAVAMGLTYAFLARMILQRGSEAMRTVIESFLSLAVVFGTVAIPLALDGLWTAGSWALEGAAIVWVALRQNRPHARIFGLCLQLGAGVAFLTMRHSSQPSFPIVNGLFLAASLVAISGFISGYFLYQRREDLKLGTDESLLCFFWALLWWCGAGIHEVDFFAPYKYRLSWNLGFGTLSSLLAYFMGRTFTWPYPCRIYRGFCLLLIPAALYSFIDLNAPPSYYGGWLAWLTTLGIGYHLLKLDEEECDRGLRSLLHIVMALVLVFVLTDEVSWWVDRIIRGRGVWDTVCWGLVPNVFLLLITKYHDRFPWPLAGNQTTYLYRTGLCFAIYLFLGSVFTNLTNSGNPWPLPYLPFFNPLDLVQFAVLLVLFGWSERVDSELEINILSLPRQVLHIILGALTFLWLNGVLVRTLNHWADIAFHSRAFIRSDLAQTSFSIFWTLSAFAVMLWGTKKEIRGLWMAGATLIGVVVLKLFLFDLANIGTMERIISFIAVGVICLVIGYLAPLPQKIETS